MQRDIRYSTAIMRAVEAYPRTRIDRDFQHPRDDKGHTFSTSDIDGYVECIEHRGRGYNRIPHAPDLKSYFYHVYLLGEEGLLHVRDMSHSQFAAFPIGITLAGHDFLDSIRDDSVVEKAFEQARNNGVALTMQTLATFAKHIGIEMLSSM